MAQNSLTPDGSVGEQATARVARLILQALCLVFVLLLWFRAFLRLGMSGDLALVLIVMPAWIALIYMLRRAAAAFGWRASHVKILVSAADSYFLLTSVGLCAADSALMARTLFVWLFAIALLERPAAIAAALLAGIAAYCAIALDNPFALHAGLVLAGGFVGGLCGMSWKTTLPLLWRALKHMLGEEAHAQEPGKSQEETELDAFAAAGFGRPAEPAAVALPFAQPAEPEEKIVAEDAPDHAAELEALRLVVHDKETALMALQDAKDKLAEELESLRAQAKTAESDAKGAEHDERIAKLELELAAQRDAREQAEAKVKKLNADLAAAEKEMAKLYGLDEPIPNDAPAPEKSEAGAEIEDLRRQLGEALKQKDALEKELEKSNEELMKVYGNT